MTTLSRYTYDPLDRLAARTPLAEAMARRFYKAGQLATEIQGPEQRTYLRTDSQLLAQKNQTVSILLTTSLQNSVLQANESAIAYAPYGHREQPANRPGLPGFNGEQPDPITGHYLLGNGYRAYNPVLMRFNSPDSLSPFGVGGLNAYAYCVGDPVNRSDPTGHFGWSTVIAGLRWMSCLRPRAAAIFRSAANVVEIPAAPTRRLSFLPEYQVSTGRFGGMMYPREFPETHGWMAKPPVTLEESSLTAIVRHQLPTHNLPPALQRKVAVLNERYKVNEELLWRLERNSIYKLSPYSYIDSAGSQAHLEARIKTLRGNIYDAGDEIRELYRLHYPRYLS